MKRLYPNLTAVFITAMLMFSGHSEAQELQQDTLRKNGVVNYDASDPENPPPPPVGVFNRNLITPSPDGCALMRSIDVPVDKYTGVANIQVPITEIKVAEDKSVPVVLSYQASGIKVSDVASTVGLGWRLSAGGRITRAVRSRPDDMDHYEAFEQITDDATWTYDYFEARIKDEFDDLADTEPDLFYFDYPGGGGMFVFDTDGVPRTIPGQNIDIGYDSGRFTITDKNGTEYFYATTEETQYKILDENENESSYISTWFLNHIRYANGALIVFNYKSGNTYTYENPAKLIEIGVYETMKFDSDNHVYEVTNKDPEVKRVYNKSMQITISKPKYLSSIRFKDYIVGFSYDDQRSDIEGMQKLNQITASYGEKNTLKYRLDYGTFANGSLKLKSVKDVSISDDPRNVCSFDYYEEINLPSRLSYTKDHWGYYNSDKEYSVWQPETDIYSRISGKAIHVSGIDKTPSLEYAQANTIRRIKYATGGTKEFYYELHEGLNPTTANKEKTGGLRIRKIVDRSDASAQPAETSYTYLGGINYVDTVNYCNSVYHYKMQSVDMAWGVCTYRLSTDPLNDMTDMNSCPTIYSSVIEELPNGAYTIYDYVPYQDMSDEDAVLRVVRACFDPRIRLGAEKKRMTAKTSRHFRRNLLQSETQCAADGTLVRSTEYEYSDQGISHRIYGLNYFYDSYMLESPVSGYFENTAFTAKYYLESQPICLSKITVKQGMYNLPSTTEIAYDAQRLLPTQMRNTDCEGNTIVTTMTYPYHYPTASLEASDRYTQGLAALQRAKIESAPVETVVWRNGRVVDADLNLYTLQNDRPTLTTTRKFYADPTTTLTTFPASHIDDSKNFVMDDGYVTTQEITQFDLDNTPLTTVAKGGARSSVLYGYRNTLPVAVVQGAVHGVTDVVNGKTEIVLQSTQSSDFEVERPQMTDFTMQLLSPEPVGKELEILVRLKIPKADTLLRYYVTPADRSPLHFAADLPAGTYSVKYRWTDADMTANTPQIETRISKLLYLTRPAAANTVFHTSFEEEGLAQPIYETVYKKFPKAKTGEWVRQTPYTVSFRGFAPGSYELTYWKWNTREENPQWEVVSIRKQVNSGADTHTIEASASCYIDEVRVLPDTALMTTYAYKPNIGLLAKTDPTGITEHYAYDAAGRLVSITDSEGQLVKRYTYSGYNKVIEEAINGNADLQRNITYLDGFGRREQVIQAGASPDRRKDLVQFWEYDEMGRDDAVSYLPYAIADGAGLRRSNPYGEQVSFYNDLLGTSMVHQPYIYKFYDDTPLGKVLKTRAPREAGRDEAPIEPRTGKTSAQKAALYETRHDYGFNAKSDWIRRYVLERDSVVVWQGYYESDKLSHHATHTYGTSFSDECFRVSFYDSQNRIVMERLTSPDKQAEQTYYVYDDFGRLRYTIPEPGNGLFEKEGDARTPWQLREYCYYTSYDRYGRAEKLLNAGAGWVYKLYDVRDREVMSQSAEMRRENKWLFTHYDDLDRPIRTGEYTGGDFETHRQALEAGAAEYPAFESDATLTRIYYDDYSWQDTQIPFYTYTYDRRINIDGTPVTREMQTRQREYVRGLTTGRAVKVLGTDTDKWLYTTNFYDEYARLAQCVSDMYPRGRERVINHHNAVGNPTYVYVKHEYGIHATFPFGYGKDLEYDHRDRLTNIKFLTFRDHGEKIRPPRGYMPGYDKINGKVTVAAYTYDDLGRVHTKSIHNGRETTTYAYDLAGRRISASSPSFSYTLGYDFPTLDGARPRYDGLLSEAVWTTESMAPQAYTYTYDRAGYLTEGRFWQSKDESWKPMDLYTESVEYGPCGRIDRIRRAPGYAAESVVEQRYDGFRMTSGTVDGTSFEMTYDTDGRMVFDGNQNVQVEYNILGLPERIFDDSHEIRYLYDSQGRKLAMALDGSWTYYRNTLVYEGQHTDPSLILHPEGFVAVNSNYAFLYHYHKKDHAGNVRMILDSGSAIRQTTDYYPFGLAHVYNNLDKNRWLFSGKELQDATIGTTGRLGWYHYGARMYNPLFGHWFAPDPAYQALNPYLFCANAPMCYIDEDGQFFGWIVGAFAAFGAYMGGSAANDNWNPFQWDWSSGKTWGGFFGGAIQGAIDGLSVSYGAAVFRGQTIFGGRALTKFGKSLRYTSFAFSSATAANTGISMISEFDNAMDIVRGNYYYDESKSVAGQLLQGFSRSTRERFQQFIGYNFSQGRNIGGDVNQVTYYRGAVLANLQYGEPKTAKKSGMTMGNMINGWNINSTDDSMFMHEYGHFLQSQRYGFYYGLWQAPASLVNQLIYPDSHNKMSIEVEANVFSREYFGEQFPITNDYPIY